MINIKINNYVEKTKENYIFGGIIEISIFTYLYDVNISVYRLVNEQDKFYAH